MSLWIYLHFPALQLNALQSSPNGDALNTSQGMIVVEGRKNEIIQMNQRASENGVCLGMGLATAASMCEGLYVIEYDSALESEKLKEIAHWLYMVTANISLVPPNGILLQASNMLTLYDGLANYWQALVDQLKHLPFEYSFASGFSPFAARMLAGKSFNQISQSERALFQAVKQCDLSETELSSKHITTLNRVGVHSIADLLRIPLPDIAKRFGSDLVNYVGRLTGQFHHVIDFYHPPKQFQRRFDLLFEIINLKLLEKPLLKLLALLESFLIMRDQYAHELQLELYLRDGYTSTVLVTSAAGEYQSKAWLSLFVLKLESMKVASPVIRISLSAVRVAAKQGEVSDLFDGKQGALSPLELLSVLQAKLGNESVKGIQVTEDPRPHLSSALCTPLEKAPSTVQPDQSLLRPSILLPRPKPLREKVAIIKGPERLSTGWWDGQAMIRDYFIVRAENGRWLWVYRTPKQQWFLHGMFS